MRLLPFLRNLVFLLPVLVVLFAVVAGGAAVARLGDDQVAEWLMNSAAVVIAVLLAVNLVLLVGALGIKSLLDVEREKQQRRVERMMRRRLRRRGRGRGSE